ILLSSFHSSNNQDIASALDVLKEVNLLDCFSPEGIDLSALATLIVKQNASRNYFLGSPTHSSNWDQLTNIIKKYLKSNNFKKTS
ncbi:hypothetical protein, partial [Xenorhabdus bovienii]